MNRRFAELGLDENVLTDLRQVWEDKIRRMGVAPFTAQEQPQQPQIFPNNANFINMNPGIVFITNIGYEL
jgi:hypothetical protein